MSKAEKVVAKEKKEREGVIADNPLLEYLDKAAKVLDFEFELEKAEKKSELEQFKKDYNLDKLVEETDSGKVPEQLEFYFVGNNENTRLISLAPNPENAIFLDFLASNFCAEIMRQNKLSIHIQVTLTMIICIPVSRYTNLSFLSRMT